MKIINLTNVINILLGILYRARIRTQEVKHRLLLGIFVIGYGTRNMTIMFLFGVKRLSRGIQYYGVKIL